MLTEASKSVCTSTVVVLEHDDPTLADEGDNPSEIHL
jgi:hypothetical protein